MVPQYHLIFNYLRAFVPSCETLFLPVSKQNSDKGTLTRRSNFVTSSACILSFCLCGFVQANPPEVRFPEKHRAFFQKHCLDCHDSETREGNVDLETLSFHITTVEQAGLWQKILNALNAGEMPPEDSQQPGNNEKGRFS